MSNRKYRISNQFLHYILSPIIFLVASFFSYNIFIQNFLFAEIQDFFNISKKLLLLSNIPMFSGIIIGVFFSNKKIFNRKSFVFFISFSILINILIFFLKNFYVFLFIRFLSSVGLGLLISYILKYYYIYTKMYSLNNIIAIKSGIPFGIVIAAIFTAFFVQKLGWKSAFLFLLTGFFTLISLNFLLQYLHTEKNTYIKFSQVNKAYLLMFSTLFFIIGTNFFILIDNAKIILISKKFDYNLINLYLIIISIFILFGDMISEYLMRIFNKKNLLLYLNLFAIFISISILSTFSEYLIVFFISLNLLIQTILWNITLIYLLDFFETNIFYFLIKLILIITFFGGICSSIFSYFLYENLYKNIPLIIIIVSFIFIGILLILSKYDNRNNHFMK